jgi:hypothetical protein
LSGLFMFILNNGQKKRRQDRKERSLVSLLWLWKK